MNYRGAGLGETEPVQVNGKQFILINQHRGDGGFCVNTLDIRGFSFSLSTEKET